METRAERPIFPSTDVWKREVPMSERPDGPVNLGRHRRNCKICAHQHRDEIEREFINWTGVKAIAKEFGLADWTVVYRQAYLA